MKLISLNVWGGQKFEAILDFIHRFDFENSIFCFQEVYHSSAALPVTESGERLNLLHDFQVALPEFDSFFSNNHPSDKFARYKPHLQFGLATFSPKKISAKFETIPLSSKNYLQKVDTQLAGKSLTILNHHGPPFPGDKRDNDVRLMISHKIVDVIKSSEQVILCGDFNLLPDTQSISIIEKSLKNLIAQFDISSTRSILSKFYGTPEEQKFADYTFVSEGITINRFEVPMVELSDHLPMILDFSL